MLLHRLRPSAAALMPRVICACSSEALYRTLVRVFHGAAARWHCHAFPSLVTVLAPAHPPPILLPSCSSSPRSSSSPPSSELQLEPCSRPRQSPAQLIRFIRRVAIVRGRAPRADIGAAMCAEYLRTGEVSRLMATHLGKGTLVAGWDEVLSRLIEYGLAWKLQTPPELPC